MNATARHLRSSSKLAALAALAALAIAPAAHAEGDAPAPKPAETALKMKGPELKVSLLTFFNYGYIFAGEDAVKKQNAFSLDRAYINLEPKIDDHWSARLTTDIQKPKDTEKNFTLRLKFAYLDGQKLGDSTCGARVGVIPTPFTEPAEKGYGYRVLGRMPLDAAGVISTADLGAMGTYGWNGGELRLYALNGEGYERIETTQGKDFALQVNQELTTGLNLAVTAQYGTWLGGESKYWGTAAGTPVHFDKRIITGLTLAYGNSAVRAGLDANYITSKVEKAKDSLNSLGTTVYVVGVLGEKSEIPLRVMRWDPNTDSKTGKDDETMGLELGYAYNFAGQLKLIPNVQYNKSGKADATIGGFVHFEGKI